MKDREPGSRPADPYRRDPPVIDLPKGEFSSSAESAQTGVEDAAEPQTAIEPMAATGLDGKSDGQSLSAEAGAAGEKSAPKPTPDWESPTDAAQDGAQKPATASKAAGPSVPPVAPAPVRPPEKRGIGGLVGAGLVGGMIGTAFAVGADIYWRQPPADFESRLAALETRPRPAAPTTAGAVPPASEAVERRIAALEAQTRGLADGVNAARGAAEASQKQVVELASRPVAAVPDQQAAAAPLPQPDPALREGLDRLGSRLDAAEGRLAGAAPTSAIDQLRSAIEARGKQAEERQRATEVALATVQGAAGALDRKASANGEGIAKLAAEIGKLPPSLLQAGLRTVVAGQAGQDLRNRVPLGPALGALEKLGVEPASLEPLRPYAAQPAPDAATLAAEFKPIAETMSTAPSGPAGTFADRLLRVADKIVTVRVVGDGSGRDLPGLVGRIESSLARGDLTAASAAWDSLPDEAKRLASQWGERLKARVAAETAARKLGAEALASLDAPSR